MIKENIEHNPRWYLREAVINLNSLWLRMVYDNIVASGNGSFYLYVCIKDVCQTGSQAVLSRDGKETHEILEG